MNKIASIFVCCALLLVTFVLASSPPTEQQQNLTAENVSSLEADSSDTEEDVEVTTDVEYVIEETTTTTNKYHYRGFPLSSEGEILVYNQGSKRMLNEKYAYAFGNLLDTYQAKYSMDNAYEEILRSENPTPCVVDGYPLGQSVKLTISSELQKKLYEYLEERKILGSVTVLNGDGSVAALVSYPSYNPNEELGVKDLEDHARINRCLEPQTPGSAIKPLFSVLSTKYSFGSYSDPGYLKNVDVSNWDTKKILYQTPVVRTNAEALRFSSNCYYAQLSLELGAERVLCELNDLFCYEEPLCFGALSISNSIKLTCIGDVARAGFGQREKISPLYLATAVNATVTGKLVEPFILDKTIDTITLETIADMGKTAIKRTLDENLLSETRIGMLDVTTDLGLSVAGNSKIYSKTGTAEMSTGINDIHYIASVILNQEEEMKTTTVVFQYCNSPKKYASGDKFEMQEILNIVFPKD